MASRLPRARQGSRSAPQMLAALITLLFVFSIHCCQGAKGEEQEPMDLINVKKDTHKDVSGLETDVDDPQGIYPQKQTMQRMSNTLALEGDEESTGQTLDNTADVSPGRRKRTVLVGSRPDPEDRVPRHRRLHSQQKRGLLPTAHSWSVPSPSLSSLLGSQTAEQRARRDTGHHSSESAAGGMSSVLTSDTGRQQQVIRLKRRGKSMFQWLASRPAVPAVGTARNRHRRDIEQQEVPHRQPRQADDESDDSDSDDDDSDDNENEKDNEDSNEGDEDDNITDRDDGGSDFAVLRKKRMSDMSSGKQPETTVQHEAYIGQTDGLIRSQSSVERQRRQSDNEELGDSSDDDDENDDDKNDADADDGDNDLDDDDSDNADEKKMKRKREALRGFQTEKQSPSERASFQTFISSPFRSKRQENALDPIDEASSDDDNDDDDADDGDQGDDADDDTKSELDDGLEMGAVRRKRGYLPLIRVLREEPTPDTDEVDDSDDDDDDDGSEDTLKNALADMLDEMVDNDEGLSSLRRKRSVPELDKGHHLLRLQRSTPAIRQILQEMAEEEEEDDDEDDMTPDELTRRKRHSNLQSEHRLYKRDNYEDVSELLGAVDQSNEDDADDEEAEETKLNDIALDMAADSIREDPEDYDDNEPDSSSGTPTVKARRETDRKASRQQRQAPNIELVRKDSLGAEISTAQGLQTKDSTDLTNTDITLSLSDQAPNRGTPVTELMEINTNSTRIRKRKSIIRSLLPPDVNDSDGLNIPLNHHRTRNRTDTVMLPSVSFKSGQEAEAVVSAKTKLLNNSSVTKKEKNDNVMARKVSALPANSSENMAIVTQSWNNNITKQTVKHYMDANDESGTNISTQIKNSIKDPDSDPSYKRKNSLSTEKVSNTTRETLQNEETAGPSSSPRSGSSSTINVEGFGNSTTNVVESEANANQLQDNSTSLTKLSANSSTSDKQDLLKGPQGVPAQKKQKHNFAQQAHQNRKPRRDTKQRSKQNPWDKTILQSVLLANPVNRNQGARQRRAIKNSDREPKSPQMLKRSIVLIHPGVDSTSQARDIVSKYKDADRTLEDILDNALGSVPNPVPDPIPTIIQLTPEADDDEDDDDDDEDDDLSDEAENIKQMAALSKDRDHGFIALSAMGKIKNERDKAKNKVRLEKMKAQDTLRKEKNEAKQDLAKERKKAKSQLQFEKTKAKQELRQEKKKAKLALREEERKAKQRISKMLDYPNDRFARDVSSDLEDQLKDVVKGLQKEKAPKDLLSKPGKDQLDSVAKPRQHILSSAVTEEDTERKLTENKTAVIANSRLTEKQKERIVAETAFDIDRAVHSVLEHIGENIRKTRGIEGDVIQELFKPEFEKQREAKERPYAHKDRSRVEKTDNVDDDSEDTELGGEEDTDRNRRSIDEVTDDASKRENIGQKRRSTESDYADDGEVFNDENGDFENELLDEEDVQIAKRRSVFQPYNGLYTRTKTDQSSPVANANEEEAEEEDDKKEVLVPDDEVKNIMVSKQEADKKNAEELEEALVFEEDDEDGPNSGYTQWSEWGACSVTCAVGRRQRSRTCEDQGRCQAGNVEEDVCMMGKCQIAT